MYKFKLDLTLCNIMIFWLINDFVRSGQVWLSSAEEYDDGSIDYWPTFNFAGNEAIYWYSHALSEAWKSAIFMVSSSDVTPVSNDARDVGFSLRCLSTVLDR